MTDQNGHTRRVSALTRLARWLGPKPWFAAVGRVVLPPVDRLTGKLTKGRFISMRMRELPALLLTTTGRKSGQPRATPLLYTRDGDGFVVIGSNWGQRHHPDWSSNLVANPRATVTLGGQNIPVLARLITGSEREPLWEELLTMWPAYATYTERAGGRTLRLFRLEPTD